MQSEELTVEEAADRFSVTVRTIFRIMRRCREASEDIGEEELEAFGLAKQPNLWADPGPARR
jgi:predicted DNA-binding transcriptional regulator YafY